MNKNQLEDAEKTFLITEGLCRTCQKWVKINPSTGCMAKHKDGKKPCSNRSSEEDLRYRVTNLENAKKLAKMITEDDGICLSGWGCGWHSVSCGDGRRCWESRVMLAKALADFVLGNLKNPERE